MLLKSAVWQAVCLLGRTTLHEQYAYLKGVRVVRSPDRHALRLCISALPVHSQVSDVASLLVKLMRQVCTVLLQVTGM